MMIEGGQTNFAIQPNRDSTLYAAPVLVPSVPQLSYQPQSAPQSVQIDIESQNRVAQVVIPVQPNQVVVTDEIARAAYGDNYKQMKIPEVVELD